MKASANFAYSADVYSSPFTMKVGNTKVSLSNSNLSIIDGPDDDILAMPLFSSNVPSNLVSLPNNVKFLKDPDYVIVRFGNSNVLKASSSMFTPSSSNGTVSFVGSSYSNVSFQPLLVHENPVVYTRDIRAPNITTLTTTSTWNSNLSISTSNALSNYVTKNGPAEIIANTTNVLTIRNSSGGSRPWEPGCHLDFRAYNATNSRSARIASTDGSSGGWAGQMHFFTKTSNGSDTDSLGMAMVIDEQQRVGVGTWTPTTKLDVVGTVNATSYTGPTITSLSNAIVEHSTSIAEVTGLVFNSQMDLYSTNLNLTNLSNVTVPSTTFSSNTSVFTSNALATTNTNVTAVTNKANWSSNTLFPKTGGNILGSNITVSPVSDMNRGIRLFGTGNDGSTLTNFNGGLGSWNGIGFQCLTDGVCRFLHETRTGHTTIVGNLVCPTTQTMSSNITTLSNAVVENANDIAEVNGLVLNTQTDLYLTNQNVTGLSNFVYPTTQTLSSNITWTSNTSVWSSNNLLRKTGDGEITGKLALSDGIILKNGNENIQWANRQVTFGFGQTSNYAHAIQTRHNAQGGLRNSIDFMLWDSNVSPSNAPTTNAMSITARGVGIYTSNPTHDLTVNGNLRTSSYISSASDVYVSGNMYAAGRMSCKGGYIPYGGSYIIGTEFAYHADDRNYIVGDTSIALGSNTACTIGDTYVNMYDGTARLYVAGNTSINGDVYASTMFARDGLVCGASQTTEKIKVLHPFVVEVGSSTTQKKTRNALDIGTTMPDTDYYGIVSFANTSGDVFVGSIDNLTTTTCSLHTFRVDGTAWGTNLVAHVLLWKY